MRIDNNTPLTPEVEATPVAPITPTGKKKRGRPSKKPTLLVGVPSIIHIMDVLDSSGSMNMWGENKYAVAKEGLVDKIKQLSKDSSGVTYTYTLLEFSNDTIWKYKSTVDATEAVSIVSKLRHQNGGTALNDAICDAIDYAILCAAPGVNTLINVLTDGGEGHSRRYRPDDVVKRIAKGKDHNITVTFVGTPEDVERAIKLYSVERSNTVTHDNTSRGVKMSSEMTTNATMRYAKNVVSGQSVADNFYSQS